MDYRMFKITAAANQEILDIIAEILRLEGKRFSRLRLAFFGVEAAVGTQIRINNNLFEVPLSGQLLTPYTDGKDLKIDSLKFVDGCDDQNIYVII